MVKFGGMTSVRVVLNGFARMLAGTITVLVTDAPGGAAAGACGRSRGIVAAGCKSEGDAKRAQHPRDMRENRHHRPQGNVPSLDRRSPLAAEPAPMQHPGSATERFVLGARDVFREASLSQFKEQPDYAS